MPKPTAYKLLITGPRATGKTTLAHLIASNSKGIVVFEDFDETTKPAVIKRLLRTDRLVIFTSKNHSVQPPTLPAGCGDWGWVVTTNSDITLPESFWRLLMIRFRRP